MSDCLIRFPDKIANCGALDVKKGKINKCQVGTVCRAKRMDLYQVLFPTKPHGSGHSHE